MAKATASDLPHILLATARACRTGVIRFEQGSIKKQLVLRAGFVAFAESNSQEEHLARILTKLNLLTRKQLTEIATLMKAGRKVDEAILACSKLDTAGLERGALEQSVTIMASIFGWSEYETHFYPGEGLIQRQMDLRLPLPELLVLAARRAVSGRLVPRLSGRLQGSVWPAENRHGDLLTLPLNSAEALAFSLVKEPAVVGSLLHLLPAGEAKPEELIQRLALLGLVRLDATPVASETTSPTVSSAETSSDHLEELLRRFEVANHYEILSVAADATDAEIKQAYHELALQYHPDRFQSQTHDAAVRSLAERLFIHITGAYAALSDRAARAAYDEARLIRESQVEAALQARAAADSDQENTAEALFRAGRLSLSQGDFEKAVQVLKECVWLRPGVARYHHFLGVAQSEVPRLRKEAEQHLLRALEMDKAKVRSRLALGKLYVKANLPRKAELQLNEVLELDPGNAEAIRLLSEITRDASGQGSMAQRLR